MNRIDRFVRSVAVAVVFLSACAAPPPQPIAVVPADPVPIRLDPAEFSLRGLMTTEAELDSLFTDRLGSSIPAISPDEIQSYLDEQEDRLRAALGSTEITVHHLGDYLTVRVPVRAVFFMSGSDLNPAAFGALESLARALDDYDSSLVEIASHTAASNSEEYDVTISARRARAIATALATLDIDSSRMIEVASGSASPVVSGDSVGERELNRRIELNLIPVRDREAEAAAAAAAAAALAAAESD